MAGLFAEMTNSSPRDGAGAAINWSIPLEDLADPAAEPGPIYDFNLDEIGPDLRDFLLQGQSGARHVARMLFKRVSETRRGMFSTDVAERAHTERAAVFSDLPLDSAHFGVPYFAHILQGLRSEAPSYVTDVLAGQHLPETVTDNIGGIVVLRC
jgi:hypothetical protein